MSHTAASLHLTVGEVLVLPQQVSPVPPQAWHLYVPEVLSDRHWVNAAVHLLLAQQGWLVPPQATQVPATPVA